MTIYAKQLTNGEHHKQFVIRINNIHSTIFIDYYSIHLMTPSKKDDTAMLTSYTL